MAKTIKFIQFFTSLIIIALMIFPGKFHLDGPKAWLAGIAFLVMGGAVFVARNIPMPELRWQFGAYLFFIITIYYQILIPGLILNRWIIIALSIMSLVIVLAINGKSFKQKRSTEKAENNLVELNWKERWLQLQLQDPKMMHTLEVLQTHKELLKNIEELYRLERYLIGGSVPIVITEQIKKMSTSEYLSSNQQYAELLAKVSKVVSDSEVNIKEYSQWIGSRLNEILQLYSLRNKN